MKKKCVLFAPLCINQQQINYNFVLTFVPCIFYYSPKHFCVVLCIVCFVSFCVLFVCKCVLYYCHWATTQLQLTNISHMYNEQTDEHSNDSLLYRSLFIAPKYFSANASSSGSFQSVPAKLHKRVHAVSVIYTWPSQ